MKKKELDQYKEQMMLYADQNGQLHIYQNPEIDHLLSLMLPFPVPTKQDKFVPISAFQKNEDGTETPIKNLYQKSDDNQSIARFSEEVRKAASEIFNEANRIKKPDQVEVIISVSTLERRCNEVDVDNLAKCVLDALNGIAFDDDAQVSSLVSQKFVHPMKVDGLLIAITKLSAKRRGIFGDPALYSFTPWEANENE